MKKLLSAIIMVASIFLPFTSCTKTGVGATIGVGLGPIWVQFNIGNGGGNYYPYGNIPGNVSSSIAYINAYPLDETRIPVFDQSGQMLGFVNCPSGTGSQTNMAITAIRNWFASGHITLPVLVNWNQRWTNAPWDGSIIGF